MSNRSVFDLVDALIQAFPLTPDTVATILGAPIVRDAAADTGAIEAYAQGAAQGSRWASIDLRMPDPDLDDGGVFLGLALAADEGIDRAAVIARWGAAFHAEVPSPRYAPGTVPLYLVYAQPWGSLSFGVGTDAAARLQRVVIAADADSSDEADDDAYADPDADGRDDDADDANHR